MGKADEERGVVSVEDRVKFIDGQQRQRSAALLCFGASMGLLGFGFVAWLGFHEIYTSSHREAHRHQLLGHWYASDNDYMPQSVSEMVHDPASAVGKVFFGFMMIGAICMMVSWYPQELGNVFVGDDALCCCVFGPSLVTARNFLPPVGMMLVACITAVPAPQAHYDDNVSTNIHTLGAIAMIGGYAVLEIHALWPGRAVIRIKRAERIMRWVTIGICLSGAVVFQYCGSVIVNPGPPDSCWDKWAIPVPRNETHVDLVDFQPGAVVWNKERASEHVMRLVDTAYGSCLLYKQANYIGECVAGVFMIANMLVIWFFCDERKINLEEYAMIQLSDGESDSTEE